MLGELNKNYSGGLVDGEGTIRLRVRKSKTNKIGLRFVPEVSMEMVESESTISIFNKLQDKYEGTLKHRKVNNPNHRDKIQFYVLGQKAKIMIQDLIDVLIVKRRQAELILEYFTLSEIPNLYTKNRPIPKENIKRRIEIFNEIKILNHKYKDSVLNVNKILECYN